MAKQQRKAKSLKKSSAEEITKLLKSDKKVIEELHHFGSMTQAQLLEIMPASRVGRALKTYLKEETVSRRSGTIYYYSLNTRGTVRAESLGFTKETKYRAQNIIHDAPLLEYARENLSSSELASIITEEEQKRLILSHPDYDRNATYSACDFGYRGDDGRLYFIEAEGDKYTKEMIEAKKNTAQLLGGEYIGFKCRDYWR